MNPWNIAKYTKLRHKVWGWEVTYEYDLCYKDWFLWDDLRGSLIPLDDYRLEDFEIIN